VVLRRPNKISDQHWESIEKHAARVVSADEGGDAGLIVGLCKDLVECIARVVCNERAVAYSTNDELTKVVGLAHAAIERQRGRGAAAETNLRAICQAMAKSITELGDARNLVGSGHGRATVSALSPIDLKVAVQFAFTWSEWVLGHLESVLKDEVSDLIQELSTENFSAGLLRRRLTALGLNELPEGSQHKIGVAVARRSMRGTFVVANDGIRPLRGGIDAFPPAYRLGVCEGLLLDEDGRIPFFGSFLEELIVVLSSADFGVARALLTRIADSQWSPLLVTDGAKRRELVESLRSSERGLPKELRGVWSELADWLDDVEPDEGDFWVDDDDDRD
jgi:Abortive infection C-terminus